MERGRSGNDLSPDRACASASPGPAEELNSVIVIGGGLSGLVSAYLLTQGRTQVTVLDANTHAGGRVHTERWPNGQVSELCFQEFFEENVYPNVWWLVDELGLQALPGLDRGAPLEQLIQVSSDENHSITVEYSS